MGDSPRTAYTFVMARQSSETELEMIDQRVDEAFARVWDDLEPAAIYLRAVCDREGLRALKQLEDAYQRAVEYAARSGIGCGPNRLADVLLKRRSIPTAPVAPPDMAPMPAPPEDDTVLQVRQATERRSGTIAVIAAGTQCRPTL